MKNSTITRKKAGIMNIKTALGFTFLFLIHATGFAQEKTAEPASSSLFYNPLFIGLLIVIILLLVIIVVLADVLKAAAYHKREQERKKKQALASAGKTLAVIGLIVATSGSLSAQTIVQQSAEQSAYWGLGAFTFYLMLFIIAFELFVAWMLYATAMQLLGIEERKRQKAEAKAKSVKQPSFIEKINASVAIEKETDILLDHNYDGIQELDNNLPPWWKYGFYLTIVFAFIYLVHFHISKTGKLQLGEYEEQLAQAKIDAEEYRKKASNLVDENNATLLIDKESLASGQSIYMDNCAACHGREGQGGVGPNLTDEYWMHSGGIKDVFKTIKFGWPEKGMKAWQQDLSAKQIHEVSSYIKSLHGSNPANPKEAQGEVYKEEAAAVDSLKVTVKDTVQLVHN